MVCSNCVFQLKLSYVFKLQCIKSDSQLRETLSITHANITEEYVEDKKENIIVSNVIFKSEQSTNHFAEIIDEELIGVSYLIF